MNIVPRFALTVQRVDWGRRRPVGEWCVWIYMVTMSPNLAGVKR